MEFVANLLVESLGKVWVTFTHNWPFLLASVLISVGLKLYVKPEKISTLLTRYRKVGVLGATAAAVTTPFCSCGTTAVILGMIASTIPWAPIVAFMVASPLTSPQGLVYSAGLFGWPFAFAFFVSSILLGLMGGALAEFCQSRGWLSNQARFAMQSVEATHPTSKPVTVSLSSRVRGCACEAIRQIQLEPMLADAPALSSASCCAPLAVPKAPVCGCASSDISLPQKTETCGCGSSGQRQVSSVEKPAVSVVSRFKLREWLLEIYLFWALARESHAISMAVDETPDRFSDLL